MKARVSRVEKPVERGNCKTMMLARFVFKKTGAQVKTKNTSTYTAFGHNNNLDVFFQHNQYIYIERQPAYPW